jgi:membrane protein YdbS with pleckstrin-like domain
MTDPTRQGSDRLGDLPTAAEPPAHRSPEEPQGLLTTPAARLDAARAAVAAGDTVTAIRQIRGMFAGSPHLEALFYCGAVSEQLGKLRDARSWYDRVLLLDGSHRGARSRLAAMAQAPPAAKSQAPHVAAATVASEGFGFYAALKGDTSPISKNAVALIDQLQMTKRPKMSDSPGALLLLVVFLPIFFVTFIVTASVMRNMPDQAFVLPVIGVGIYVVLIVHVLLRRATRYELREGFLKITQGILHKQTVTYELFRVTGVGVDRAPMQRLFGSGTLILNVEEPGGAVKEVRLIGLARGRDLLRLQDDLRNLAQLLRQNPLIKGIIS